MRRIFPSMVLFFLFLCSIATAQGPKDWLDESFSIARWYSGNGIQSIKATGTIQFDPSDAGHPVVLEAMDHAYTIVYQDDGHYIKVQGDRGIVNNGHESVDMQPYEATNAQPWYFPFFTDLSKYPYGLLKQLANNPDCLPIQIDPQPDSTSSPQIPVTLCISTSSGAPVKLEFDLQSSDTPSAKVHAVWKYSDFRSVGPGVALPFHIEETLGSQQSFILQISGVELNTVNPSDFAF